MVMNLSEQVKHEKPFWTLAFRPFFLAGSLFGVVAMLIWLGFWAGLSVPINPLLGAVEWHGHEMLFGFGVAIIFGFVLTAVQTWTGIPGLKNRSLILVWCLWLLARIGFLLPNANLFWPAAIADLLFEIVALAYLLRSVLLCKQWDNVRMALVPLLMIIANAVFYYAVSRRDQVLQQQSLEAVVWLFALIISVMGGRVIPFFTAKKLGVVQASKRRWLEVGVQLVLVVLAVNVFANWLSGSMLSALAMLAAVLHLYRWLTWHVSGVWQVPLLWSLYLAYLFMPICFLAVALQEVLAVPKYDLLHLLSIGSISGMILTMISRVSLGHTGRNLTTTAAINLAFVLINVAAVLRFLPALMPQLRLEMYQASGFAWIVAFGIFVISYWTVLTSPRVDGVRG